MVHFETMIAINIVLQFSIKFLDEKAIM